MFKDKTMSDFTVDVLDQVKAVDLEEYAFSQELREKYRQELNIPADAFVVGHVGRFMYQKNHAFLIDVFRGGSPKLKSNSYASR